MLRVRADFECVLRRVHVSSFIPLIVTLTSDMIRFP